MNNLSDLYCKFVTNKPYPKKIYWSKSKHTEHFDLPFQDLSTKQEIKPKNENDGKFKNITVSFTQDEILVGKLS